MIMNNILNGLIAFFISIFLVLGFNQMFNNLWNLIPSEAQIFIGAIIGLTILYVGFWAPIEIVSVDDKGEIN